MSDADSMTPEERARALSKIKKCLALSASPEPHEAAAALRQAQALMRKLGVTAEEVEAPDITEAVVKTREGYGNCAYMNLMTDVIEEAFGVKAFYSRNPGSANRLNVKYVGPRGRVELAEYTHRVVQRALEDAWTQYLSRHPWFKGLGGKRRGFYQGWLWSIHAQVSELVPTEREAAATERFIALRYGALETVEARKRPPLDQDAAQAGAEAAAEFSINVPLTQEQLKLGHS
jgi:hypothetical protein